MTIATVAATTLLRRKRTARGRDHLHELSRKHALEASARDLISFPAPHARPFHTPEQFDGRTAWLRETSRPSSWRVGSRASSSCPPRAPRARCTNTERTSPRGRLARATTSSSSRARCVVRLGRGVRMFLRVRGLWLPCAYVLRLVVRLGRKASATGLVSTRRQARVPPPLSLVDDASTRRRASATLLSC